MKRKILVTAIITATLFILMAVSASACRQLPNVAAEAVDSGSISLGKTEVTTTGDQCLKYTFTPDKDGFYALVYSDHDCSFLKYVEEDDCKCYSFYYYISHCWETDDGYVTTEFVEMNKGEEYTLYVVNPSAYDEYYGEETEHADDEKMTSTIEIKYAGELVDFDICDTDLTFYKEARYDVDTDSDYDVMVPSGVEEWEDGNTYFYTGFNAEFSELGTYFGCSLNENSCCIVPLKIIGDADFHEGENTITLELFDIQKEFTVNCSYDPYEFLTYSTGSVSQFVGKVENLIANINIGLRVIMGLEGIGSANPNLGAEVIKAAFARFFWSFMPSCC